FLATLPFQTSAVSASGARDSEFLAAASAVLVARVVTLEWPFQKTQTKAESKKIVAIPATVICRRRVLMLRINTPRAYFPNTLAREAKREANAALTEDGVGNSEAAVGFSGSLARARAAAISCANCSNNCK